MTSLHVTYGLAPSPNQKSWLRLCIKPCAYLIRVVASVCCYAHLHERLLTTLQRCKIYVALLPVQKFFGMEVWNGIWKKILIWNGRFLVWNGNGMEENCQYGIWKNYLSFHSIPCPVCSSKCYQTRNQDFAKEG